MAQVSITINGRSYLVACDDGQEDHLQSLGGYIDEKVQQMIQQVGTAGPVGGSRLLVLAALVIADELYEAQRELETGERQPGAESASGPASSGARDQAVSVLENCARRIDDLAAGLQEA